jgi:hypothetical protein
MVFPIFIASSIDYELITLPKIIQNIKDSHIDPNYVFVISGGYENESISKINNITVIHTTYRCFEFTPLIYIIKNPDLYNFEYAFFTHDTVEFGESFYSIIDNMINEMKKNGYETKKIDSDMSMNIGIYSKDIILKNKEELLKLSLNTNNSDELWKMKNFLVGKEDFILNAGKKLNNSIDPFIIPYQTYSISGKEQYIYKKIYENIDFIISNKS